MYMFRFIIQHPSVLVSIMLYVATLCLLLIFMVYNLKNFNPKIIIIRVGLLLLHVCAAIVLLTLDLSNVDLILRLFAFASFSLLNVLLLAWINNPSPASITKETLTPSIVFIEFIGFVFSLLATSLLLYFIPESLSYFIYEYVLGWVEVQYQGLTVIGLIVLVLGGLVHLIIPSFNKIKINLKEVCKLETRTLEFLAFAKKYPLSLDHLLAYFMGSMALLAINPIAIGLISVMCVKILPLGISILWGVLGVIHILTFISSLTKFKKYMELKYGEGCIHSLGYNPKPEDLNLKGGYKIAGKTAVAIAVGYGALEYLENRIYVNDNRAEAIVWRIKEDQRLKYNQAIKGSDIPEMLAEKPQTIPKRNLINEGANVIRGGFGFDPQPSSRPYPSSNPQKYGVLHPELIKNTKKYSTKK